MGVQAVQAAIQEWAGVMASVALWLETLQSRHSSVPGTRVQSNIYLAMHHEFMSVAGIQGTSSRSLAGVSGVQ